MGKSVESSILLHVLPDLLKIFSPIRRISTSPRNIPGMFNLGLVSTNRGAFWTRSYIYDGSFAKIVDGY